MPAKSRHLQSERKGNDDRQMVERLDQLRREQLSDTRWWAAHSDRVLAMLGSMFASGQLNPWEMDAKNRSDCVHDAAEIVWDVLHRGGRNL